MASRFDQPVVDRITQFVELVVAANDRQNLISPASIATIWARHVVDSAQLLAFAPDTGSWVDIGTGGGFPGMIVALCRPGRTVMVEPRRLRADFLTDSIAAFGLDNAVVMAAKIEAVVEPAAVISARAVASVGKLLHAARRCATPKTRWILPRGRSSDDEPSIVGMFHVEQSVTDPASRILLIDGIGS